MRADIKKYFDEYGLLCTEHLDGGDSCNRMSLLMIALEVLTPKERAEFFTEADMARIHHAYSIAFLRCKYIPPRHPDRWKWYSDIRTTSRDQLVPWFASCLLLGEHAAIDRFYAWHKTKLCLFAPNTYHGATYQIYDEHMEKLPGDPFRPGWKCPDPTGPEIWAFYSRAFNQSDWVRNMWDWHLLKGVEHHIDNPSKHVDKLIPRLIAAKYVQPTKNSKKALAIMPKQQMIAEFYQLMSYENPRFIAEMYERVINSL